MRGCSLRAITIARNRAGATPEPAGAHLCTVVNCRWRAEEQTGLDTYLAQFKCCNGSGSPPHVYCWRVDCSVWWSDPISNTLRSAQSADTDHFIFLQNPPLPQGQAAQGGRATGHGPRRATPTRDAEAEGATRRVSITLLVCIYNSITKCEGIKTYVNECKSQQAGHTAVSDSLEIPLRAAR